MQQLNDSQFPLSEGRELFDALGSADKRLHANPDKRLHANPGEHGEIPLDEFRWTAQYLGERLSAAA